MVYVDLLVIEDLIMNYIVILGTSIILNRVIKLKKVFLSAVVGTISLLFLFINTNKIFLFLITILFSLFMSIISFSYHDILYTFKNILYMYFFGIFLSGGIYLINVNLLPKIDSYLLNTLVLLGLAPIITFIYIKCIKMIKINYSNYYLVDIYFKDKPKITVQSFLDTGNKLIDPYTHRPIILIAKREISNEDCKTVLVPYNTIDNQGLMECIYSDKIYIHNIGYRKRVLIGLIDSINIEGADCILNSKLFS